MAMHLRQSTAASVKIGPFLDDTDFITEETGLTISASDIRLSKNGGNMVSKNSTGATHDELGYYTCAFTATDTNTVGRLQLAVHESGALPVFHEYEVLEEDVYDAIYASSSGSTLLVKGVDGDLSGDVSGNVDGSVGSVTGNVGGNVAGSVGSVTARVTADVDRVDSVALVSHTAGMFPADVTEINPSGRNVLTVDDTTVTPTTTTLAIAEASPFSQDDSPIGRKLYFADGVNVGVETYILDWDDSEKTMIYRAIPSAPSDGDTIWIVEP